MTSISRRLFLQGAGTFAWAAAGVGSYAFAFEPGFRLDVTSYELTPPRWPAGLALRAAVLADIHACEPWMPASRVRGIARLTNDLKPDIIFLLGDFTGGHRYVTGPVMPGEWGEALSILRAPLGAYSVLGNHDWWHGALPGMPADGAEGVRGALRAAGITVLENNAVRLAKNGQPFWVAGLGDQLAEYMGPAGYRSAAHLGGTMAQVNDKAPVILLAHEPAIFGRVSDRVSLTLCGHTHGGQVNLPISFGPRFIRRYHHLRRAYGHIVENGRHLIISAGLGTSIVPARFLRPPEVVLVTLGPNAAAQQS
ncbi:MAG: metallophosphoesterase [Beijerinckiaceae bacterium]|nr:metallophosphoesterase [Beijerinckiaceae bacterium]